METARRVIREFHEAPAAKSPSGPWNELVTRARQRGEAVVVEGVYRVWHRGREFLESFVAAPGPMGWRYFGRVRPPESEEELFTVDYVVDAEWGLIRYRLMHQSGTSIVATRRQAGSRSWPVGLARNEPRRCPAPLQSGRPLPARCSWWIGS
ncbi:MAG TPA: hypothetical protein VGL18_07030 [Actinomycetota bacterium]